MSTTQPEPLDPQDRQVLQELRALLDLLDQQDRQEFKELLGQLGFKDLLAQQVFLERQDPKGYRGWSAQPGPSESSEDRVQLDRLEDLVTPDQLARLGSQARQARKAARESLGLPE